MFFAIGISSYFVLPCFATGCRAFGFKIATAAVRPRNDTKTGRFCLENGRFYFLRLFFAQCRSASFFKRFVPEFVPFSRKPHQICHCEEGACARRGNLKRNDLPSRNELWLHGMKQILEIKNEEAKRRSESMSFVIGVSSCFVLPCFATGCHTFDFKIATAAVRPRNDTELGRFLGKNSLQCKGFDTL